jgi:hypothetical protein
MGETKRKRVAGFDPFMSLCDVEWEDFRVHDGRITRIAGYNIAPKAQRDVTKFFTDLLVSAHAAGEDRSSEHEERRRAAFHEAGHCVVGAAFGIVADHVQVAEHEFGGWSGRTLWAGDDPEWREMSLFTTPEYDWRLAAITIAGIAAETVSVGFQAGSSIDEQIVFILFTDVITTKLKLKRETNAAFVDGMPEVMAILGDHRQALDAIGEALMVEPELGRDCLDQMLIGVFDPRRDHAAEFIARLHAGPSQAVHDFATLAAFQGQGGRMQPTD